MNLFNKIDFKITRFVSGAHPSIYNTARFARCMLDKLAIKKDAVRGRPFVLIYQQGRAASTSVYESICDLGLPMPVYHVHTLSRQRAETAINKLKRKKASINRYLYVGKYLSDELNNSHRGRWKIVSIFREPISTMLSLHFLHGENAFKYLAQQDGMPTEEALLNHFNDIFENDDASDWDINNWYDDVFRNELQVDVYKYTLNHEKGYTIINENNLDILLLKFENLKSAFNLGVAEFFAIADSNVNLLHSNVHKDEKYSRLHDYVKDNLVIPREICEKIYDTKFMKHFYSPEDIERLIKKWSKE